MVQIPGLILECSKKKPPTKAVVCRDLIALAGFFKRSAICIKSALSSLNIILGI